VDGKFLKRGKGKIVVGKTGREVNGMLVGEKVYWY
jgi:dihydropyrimidinase